MQLSTDSYYVEPLAVSSMTRPDCATAGDPLIPAGRYAVDSYDPTTQVATISRGERTFTVKLSFPVESGMTLQAVTTPEGTRFAIVDVTNVKELLSLVDALHENAFEAELDNVQTILNEVARTTRFTAPRPPGAGTEITNQIRSELLRLLATAETDELDREAVAKAQSRILHFHGALAPLAEPAAVLFAAKIFPALLSDSDAATLREELWKALREGIGHSTSSLTPPSSRMLESLLQPLTKTEIAMPLLNRIFASERLRNEISTAKPDLALALMLLGTTVKLPDAAARRNDEAIRELIRTAVTVMDEAAERDDATIDLKKMKAARTKAELVSSLQRRELGFGDGKTKDSEDSTQQLVNALRAISDPEQLQQRIELSHFEAPIAVVPNPFLPLPSVITFSQPLSVEDGKEENRRSSDEETVAFEITLPNLGLVKIDLSITKGTAARMQMHTQSAEASEQLRASTPMLEKALAKDRVSLTQCLVSENGRSRTRGILMLEAPLRLAIA